MLTFCLAIGPSLHLGALMAAVCLEKLETEVFTLCAKRTHMALTQMYLFLLFKHGLQNSAFLISEFGQLWLNTVITFEHANPILSVHSVMTP